MTNQELLISHINKLSEDEISSLLDAVTLMLRDKELTPRPACSHCTAQSVIRYGFKCKKQRFLCKNCGRTFVSTTNTIMTNSHFPASVWKVMRQTPSKVWYNSRGAIVDEKRHGGAEVERGRTAYRTVYEVGIGYHDRPWG